MVVGVCGDLVASRALSSVCYLCFVCCVGVNALLGGFAFCAGLMLVSG